jgi:hypothetical protein
VPQVVKVAPRPLGLGTLPAMDVTLIAALLYLAVSAFAVAFQLGLAAGAPWGTRAMGGRWPGRFPPALRVLAVVQAVVLSTLAIIVLSTAGVVWPGVTDDLPWLIWVVVLFSAASLVVNLASPSPPERRLWVPVAAVMLVCSLVVALDG